jgi:hypothetical protein
VADGVLGQAAAPPRDARVHGGRQPADGLGELNPGELLELGVLALQRRLLAETTHGQPYDV